MTAIEPDVAMSVPQVSRHPRRLHPMLIMLGVLLLAVALTHVIPSGKFERHAGQVVPGSYHSVAKSVGPGVLLAAGAPTAAISRRVPRALSRCWRRSPRG